MEDLEPRALIRATWEEAADSDGLKVDLLSKTYDISSYLAWYQPLIKDTGAHVRELLP